MYKYLFLITATLFLSSCSTDTDGAIDSEPKDSTLSTTSVKANPPYKPQPKTTAEEVLSNYEVSMIRNNYPTLESAIAGLKDEGRMAEDLLNKERFPNFMHRLVFWDELVGMDWDELNSIPKTNYQRMKKDIISESGKGFCFEGMVHEIRVNREITPPVTEALMYVPYEGYIAIMAVRSSGDILPEEKAKFCGIATGNMYYQTLMGEKSSPYLLGMFDLPENK